MACEATRPTIPGKDKGWICTGAGLITVIAGTETMPPVVAPEVALAALLAGEFAEVYEPRPFEGGDHLHLVLEASMTMPYELRSAMKIVVEWNDGTIREYENVDQKSVGTDRVLRLYRYLNGGPSSTIINEIPIFGVRDIRPAP